jgi:hypothetical protein
LEEIIQSPGIVAPGVRRLDGIQNQFPEDQLGRGRGKPLPFPAVGRLGRENELGGHFPILPLTTGIVVGNEVDEFAHIGT